MFEWLDDGWLGFVLREAAEEVSLVVEDAGVDPVDFELWVHVGTAYEGRPVAHLSYVGEDWDYLNEDLPYWVPAL